MCIIVNSWPTHIPIDRSIICWNEINLLKIKKQYAYSNLEKAAFFFLFFQITKIKQGKNFKIYQFSRSQTIIHFQASQIGIWFYFGLFP